MWRKEFSQTIITQYKDRYENDKAECNVCTFKYYNTQYIFQTFYS